MGIKDVADYLNVSVSEVRKLVRENQIPYFRIGNRIKIRTTDLNNWIDDLKKLEKVNNSIF